MKCTISSHYNSPIEFVCNCPSCPHPQRQACNYCAIHLHSQHHQHLLYYDSLLKQH